MAKTIKFDLVCDQHRIRTIEDLQNNFNINDIYEYFSEGILERWLQVREYNEYYEVIKINKCSSIDSIVKRLVKIFLPDINDEDISRNILILKYNQDRDRRNIECLKNNCAINQSMHEYMCKYNELICLILKGTNSKNRKKILAISEKLADDYYPILKNDFYTLFYNLYKYNFYAILCFLTNEKTRKLFWNLDFEGNEYKLDEYPLYGNWEKDKNEVITVIQETLNEKLDFIKLFCETYSSKKANAWSHLSNRGNKVMIISLDSSDRICRSEDGIDKEEESILGKETRNKLLVTNGLFYNSADPENTIIFMEIKNGYK